MAGIGATTHHQHAHRTPWDVDGLFPSSSSGNGTTITISCTGRPRVTRSVFTGIVSRRRFAPNAFVDRTPADIYRRDDVSAHLFCGALPVVITIWVRDFAVSAICHPFIYLLISAIINIGLDFRSSARDLGGRAGWA